MLFIVVGFVLPNISSAQILVPNVDYLSTGSIEEIAGTVIQLVLGLLGLIALVIVLYAGFMWMTSAGNEEKISQAKKMLVAGVIGLVIILASYAITSFILGAIQEGTNGGGGGQVCTPNECTGCYRCNADGTSSYYDSTCSTCGSQNGETYNFSVIVNSPTGSNVSLCSLIQVKFNNIVDETTVISQNFGLYDCGENSCNGDLVGRDNLTPNGQFIIEEDIIQFILGEDYEQEHYYAVNIIHDGITDEDGEALLVDYYWEFKTGDETDTEPPIVALVFPEDNQEEVCLTSYITAEFSEDMDMLSLNNASSFYLYEDIGILSDIDFFHQVHNDSLILYPDSNYEADEDYFPLLNGNIIKDTCGNYLDGDADTMAEGSPDDNYPPNGPNNNWRFITGENLYCTPEIAGIENTETYYDAIENLIISGHYLGNNPVLVFDGSIVIDQASTLCMGDEYWYDGACVTQAWTEEEIRVAIPVTGGDNNGTKAGVNIVEVQTNDGNVSANFDLLSPRINALSPDQGGEGQFISVWGDNFKEDESINLNASKVYFRSNQDEYIEADLPCGQDAWDDGQIIISATSTLNINQVYAIQVKKVYNDDTERWSNLADFYFNDEEAGPGLCFIDKDKLYFEDEFNLNGIKLGDEDVYNREVILGDDYDSIEADVLEWTGDDGIGQNTDVKAITPLMGSAAGVGVRVMVEETEGEQKFSNYLSVDTEADESADFYINYISPESAPIGGYVTIYGSGFGASQDEQMVEFNIGADEWTDGDFNFPDECSTAFWSDEQVIVKVPETFSGLAPYSSKIKIIDSANYLETNAVNFEVNNEGLAPCICSVNPGFGTKGNEIEIAGEYFEDPDDVDNFYFNTFFDNNGAFISGDYADFIIDSDNLMFVTVTSTQTGLISAHNINGFGNTWNFEYIEAGPIITDVWDFYGWHFTTCADCENPRIRIQDCEAGQFSPSPDSGNRHVPMGSDIYVEFEYPSDSSNAEMDGTTLIKDNFILSKCGNADDSIGTCDAVDQSEYTIPENVNPTFASITDFSFEAGYWYKIELTSAVKDIESSSLIEYSWYFRIDPSGVICVPDELYIKPSNHSTQYNVNKHIPYIGLLVDTENCYVCNSSGYDYEWESSDNSLVPEFDPDPPNIFDPNAVLNGTYNIGSLEISATSTFSILEYSDTTNLYITANCGLLDGNQAQCIDEADSFECCWDASNDTCVNADHPVCNSPFVKEKDCIPAAWGQNPILSSPSPVSNSIDVVLDSHIYAEFAKSNTQVEMDTSTYANGLKIEQCTQRRRVVPIPGQDVGFIYDECEDMTNSLNISISSSGDNFVDYTHDDFDSNFFYIITLKDSIKDISGYSLIPDGGYIWTFKTGSGYCQTTAIEVLPTDWLMNINNTKEYSTLCYDESCNVCDNIYSYEWESSNDSIAITTGMNGNFSASSTIVRSFSLQGDVTITATNTELLLTNFGDLTVIDSTTDNCANYTLSNTCNDLNHTNHPDLDCCWDGSDCQTGADNPACDDEKYCNDYDDETECNDSYGSDHPSFNCCWAIGHYCTSDLSKCEVLGNCFGFDTAFKCEKNINYDCCWGDDDKCYADGSQMCSSFKVIENYPLDDGTGVCPNTLIKATFNKALDSNSLEENVNLYVEENPGVWSSVTTTLSLYNNFEGQAVLNIKPEFLLDKNTDHKVELTNGADGIKSVYGNVLNCSNGKCLWTFTTKDTICELNYLKIIDPLPLDKYYLFTESNEQANFVVEGNDINGNIIESMDGYDWSWYWESFNEDLVVLEPSQIYQPNITAIAENNNGKTKLRISALPIPSELMCSQIVNQNQCEGDSCCWADGSCTADFTECQNTCSLALEPDCTSPCIWQNNICYFENKWDYDNKEGYKIEGSGSGVIVSPDDAELELFMCENMWPRAGSFEDNKYHFRLKYCMDGGLGYLTDADIGDNKYIKTDFNASDNTKDELLREYIFKYGENPVPAYTAVLELEDIRDEQSILSRLEFSELFDSRLSFKLLGQMFSKFINLFKGTSVYAQDNNNDIIGLRIYQNLKHLSSLDWYSSSGLISFKGNPQPIKVGPYDGLRDGRTVYVSVGDESNDGDLYTNMLLISHSQDASPATINIFNQLIDNWNFNINIDLDKRDDLAEDVKRWQDLRSIEKKLNNYANQNKFCAYVTDPDGASCLEGYYHFDIDGDGSMDTGECYDVSSNVTCRWDSDCEEHEMGFQKCVGVYPELNEGSFLQGISTSKWPSWASTLGNDLGSVLPHDPVNEFSYCPDDYEEQTCWHSVNEDFYCALNSQIYYYRAGGRVDLDNRPLSFDLFSEFNFQSGWNQLPLEADHALDLYNTIKINNADVCDDGYLGILCGNGTVDSGEQCDYSSSDNTKILCDGAYNYKEVGCNSNCQWPDYVESYQCFYCGDGLFSPLYEECETGWSDMICADGWNPQTVHCVGCVWESAANNCIYCGDGICQDGQDGDTAYESLSNCMQDCSCGDGICQPEYNENNGDCADDCFCGDGVVDSTEECDYMISIGAVCTTPPPEQYAGHYPCLKVGPNKCTWDLDNCSADGACGDNVVNGNEVCEIGEIAICDMGEYYGEMECQAGCLSWGNCVAIEWCGDGKLNGNEECDDGNNINGDGCDEDCVIEPVCGDGIPEGTEICDDGNTINCDGCNEDCSRVDNICGDNIPECGEICDDGNLLTETCGDNIRHNGIFCNADCSYEASLDEQCDDGDDADTWYMQNSSDDDGVCVINSYTGLLCRNNRCGDGFLDWASEECDNGDYPPSPNDGCNQYCEIEPICGDGIREGAEQCDDGDEDDTWYQQDPLDDDGACVITYNNWGISCKNNICGDGYLDLGYERCDDGNIAPGDGCDKDCVIEPCSTFNTEHYLFGGNSLGYPSFDFYYADESACTSAGCFCQDISVCEFNCEGVDIDDNRCGGGRPCFGGAEILGVCSNSVCPSGTCHCEEGMNQMNFCNCQQGR